jgi:hypothetical protein
LGLSGKTGNRVQARKKINLRKIERMGRGVIVFITMKVNGLLPPPIGTQGHEVGSGSTIFDDAGDNRIF